VDYAALLRRSGRMSESDGIAPRRLTRVNPAATSDCARQVTRTCALWRSMLATPLSWMNPQTGGFATPSLEGSALTDCV
jgi:hypothetical protein